MTTPNKETHRLIKRCFNTWTDPMKEKYYRPITFLREDDSCLDLKSTMSLYRPRSTLNKIRDGYFSPHHFHRGPMRTVDVLEHFGGNYSGLIIGLLLLILLWVLKKN